MNGVTIVKRSPVVLIRTFTAIEAIGFASYLFVAAVGNYDAIYTEFSLSRLLSYNIARFLFLAGGQLVLTVYAFLRWYYERYAIRPEAISHEWGVLFKKNKSVPLRETMSVTLASGPVGKLLHYGSIRIKNAVPSSMLVLADIPYPQKYLKLIGKFIARPNAGPNEETDVSRLLSEDEHEQLEFKSSLRFDRERHQVNKELERAAMKTVAAFLNSSGGHLVIGVGDGREPLGLEYDYKTLGRQTSDGFENHFTQVFNTMIGPEFRHLVRLRFHAVHGHEVCVVNIAPSARPVYLKLDDSEHFYVRTGNVTTPLKLSEVEAYAGSRWRRRRDG